jgi:hypothetical protein
MTNPNRPYRWMDPPPPAVARMHDRLKQRETMQIDSEWAAPERLEHARLVEG